MNHGFDGSMYPFLGGTIGFIVILFLLILAVLWFFLPFAIFGTKEKLDNIKAEIENTNKILRVIANELSARQSNASGSEKDNSEHITATRY